MKNRDCKGCEAAAKVDGERGRAFLLDRDQEQEADLPEAEFDVRGCEGTPGLVMLSVTAIDPGRGTAICTSAFLTPDQARKAAFALIKKAGEVRRVRATLDDYTN